MFGVEALYQEDVTLFDAAVKECASGPCTFTSLALQQKLVRLVVTLGPTAHTPPRSARLQRHDLANDPASSAASKLHLLSASTYDSGVILRSQPVSKPTHPSRQLSAVPSNETLEGDMMGVRVR